MSLWLIGAGFMAQDYAHVLKALDYPFETIGRGSKSATIFEKNTGLSVHQGGLVHVLSQGKNSPPKQAIVAVGVEQLAATTKTLIQAGTKHILLEKPGGLDLAEISQLQKFAYQFNARVLLAYNRRFYSSVERVREIIHEDGGLLGVQFEFTEWAHKIDPLHKAPGVKEHWLLGNSSHVIDLVFHLCGLPKDWQCWNSGSLSWHPASARFCGAGITQQDIMFSYLSDWQAPGRWGVELLTRQRRLLLRPMEQLQVIMLGSVTMQAVELDDKLDQQFKPGLYKQTKAFLETDDNLFCSLDQQVKNMQIYSKMAGYK